MDTENSQTQHKEHRAHTISNLSLIDTTPIYHLYLLSHHSFFMDTLYIRHVALEFFVRGIITTCDSPGDVSVKKVFHVRKNQHAL